VCVLVCIYNPFCLYNPFQNKKDFDGDQDIATNYPPRDGLVIPLSSCNFSHEMGLYTWDSKSYGFNFIMSHLEWQVYYISI
jgi:hypothetical protein